MEIFIILALDILRPLCSTVKGVSVRSRDASSPGSQGKGGTGFPLLNPMRGSSFWQAEEEIIPNLS